MTSLRMFTSVLFSKQTLIIMLLLHLFGLLIFHILPIIRSADNTFSSADSGEEFRSYSADYFESWPGYKVKSVSSLSADIPVIIWWTDQGNLNPHGNEKGRPYTHLTCPNGASCYSTAVRDPNLLADGRARGFLFYGTDVDPFDLPLPRLKHHEWALLHEESPLNNYMLIHHEMLQQFNHTSTFNRHSDYPLSTQAIVHPDYLLQRRPVSIEQKNKVRKERGLAAVVYVQSHCDVPSDRDSYVKELMKYINIDSYGDCLHNKDLPKKLEDPASTFDHTDFYDLLSVYKFNIAFENAYCDDYMTEKIMRPLHIGVVPVYKGSAVIQDWMPNNHSVIFVDNFKSPKDLADFLKYLDENDDEYEKYLSFKEEDLQNQYLRNHLHNREWSEGSKDFFRGFECHVCKQISERMQAEKLHAVDPSSPLLPPRVAANSHLACPVPRRLDAGQGISQFWPEIDWTSLYWEGLDKARAVLKMMEAEESDSKQFSVYLMEEIQKFHTKRHTVLS